MNVHQRPRSAPLRAVVFDLFDTLIDLHMDRLPYVEVLGKTAPGTQGLLHAALAERADVDFETFASALLEVDTRFRAAYLREDRELSTRERFRLLAERLGLDDAGLPVLLTRVHMRALCETAVAHPHHARVLAALRRRYRLGLCSNFSDSATARELLRETDLLPYLDELVISEDVGIRKPRAEIFAEALSRLGVEPGEAVHVGDSLTADVEGASRMGIRTAWITRRVPDPEASLRARPDTAPTWIVRDLAELPDLLARPPAPEGSAA